MMMTIRQPSNKVHNKKLRRRREGLSTKCYEYGELDGVEIALFVRYTKRGDFYSYKSKKELPWLRDVDKMMTHPKTRAEYPDDLKKRVEGIRRKARKAAGATTPVEADPDGSDEAASPEFSALTAFPDFECDLTMVMERLRNE